MGSCALLLALQTASRISKTCYGEQDEGDRFQCEMMGVAETDRCPPETVNLPRDRVCHRYSAEPLWQRFQGIKDIAGEQKHKIENRRDRVEDVVPSCAEREDGVKKEPTRGSDDHYQERQWHAMPAEMNMEQQGGQRNRDHGLHQADEQRK